jgi:hypothetical protein
MDIYLALCMWVNFLKLIYVAVLASDLLCFGMPMRKLLRLLEANYWYLLA